MDRTLALSVKGFCTINNDEKNTEAISVSW